MQSDTPAIRDGDLDELSFREVCAVLLGLGQTFACDFCFRVLLCVFVFLLKIAFVKSVFFLFYCYVSVLNIPSIAKRRLQEYPKKMVRIFFCLFVLRYTDENNKDCMSCRLPICILN